MAQLAAETWIDAGKPVVSLGDSGTGKTHLGTAAAEQRRRGRYVTTAALVNELAEATDAKQLSCVVACYGRLDLHCLDEPGYVNLDARGAELLFQFITGREERASIVCPSNAPFGEWGATFTDPRLAVAVVNRLPFNAHIINARTSSYRLRATRAQKGAPTTCPSKDRRTAPMPRRHQQSHPGANQSITLGPSGVDTLTGRYRPPTGPAGMPASARD